MKPTNVFGSCLVRQVNEAVRIEMSKADCVMNSKSEFHQAPLVRVVPVNGLVEAFSTMRATMAQCFFPL